ncbi:MAG: aminotransferase class III-fold pyridoxal phosphate-dependent enzyme, partial [Planctomycetota bacterium]
MKNISMSLRDLLGPEYIDSVCEAQAFLSGTDAAGLKAIAAEKVDLFPEDFQKRIDDLLSKVGEKVCRDFSSSSRGAGTESFKNAQNDNMSPLSGLGFFRIGEDGRLYLAGKSEHYHASLGHHFPGYKLLEKARAIGICNVTHNNTRGHITRLLERELIRIANGIERGDEDKLNEIINSDSGDILNRVINLETGSLAVEASLKMMLARFYRLDNTFDTPKYSGKVPVFFVIADNKGGRQANYHGTTVLTQILRGMWPELSETLEENNQYLVRSVNINDIDHFNKLIAEYDDGKYKVAGFFHELVLMNYGGIRLSEDFIQAAHKVCKERDIPVTVDEIQSCMWSPELFMFKEYDLMPDFVSVGKGFPGGQYPASKILTNSKMDSLNQFGALVTNGQEELASLAYLITMEFAQENSAETSKIGKYYRCEAEKLVGDFSQYIDKVEGDAHMTTLFFSSAEKTVEFTSYLNKECCIDISAQTYKADCPPAALTKLPLIASEKAVDFVIG